MSINQQQETRSTQSEPTISDNVIAADNVNDVANTSDASTLEENKQLVAALANQLQYYFSPQNLSKDTYLNTIMQLNSGYVPTSILSGFANVNRIITRSSTDGVVPTGLDVQRLLGKSALQSSALKIVLLGQDGQVLASYGDDHFEELKGPLTFEAVGFCSDYASDNSNGNDNLNQVDSTQEDEKKGSIVILRDVPEAATEEDVRGVFKSDDENIVEPNITNVQKEVGQYWFVTIDSSTSQQDLVSILLDLGSKKICDQPVKARLKTQSVATQGVPMQGGGWNPYRSKYNGYNNNGNVYAGDRVSFNRRKFSNKPFSKKEEGAGEAAGSQKGNDDGRTKAKVEKAGPPPPLVEEHFPGLAGSPKSTASDGNVHEKNKGVKKEIATNSGYAAALLKAAPPVPEVSSQPESQNRPLPKPKTHIRKFDDSKSTGTLSTDGSSADDKSSGSKVDTEIVTTTVHPSPVKTWGSGPSFAEILKK